MIEPSVYLFKEKEENYELYLGEYCTIQGLLLFDDNQKVLVLSANGSNLDNNDWITQKHFENVKNAKQLIELLDNPSINLIDIEIEIVGFGSLRTHDDGECHFQSTNKVRLISLLEKIITKRDYLPLRITLLEHPNEYVSYHPSGNMVLYSSFDDFHNSTE